MAFLSSSQFHPVYTSPGGMQLTKMSHVLKMDSVDTPGHEVGGEYGNLQKKMSDVQGWNGYDDLTEAMRSKDPRSIPPLHVGTSKAIRKSYRASGPMSARPMLGNGGHRSAIAHDLGWKVIATTPYKSASGYGDSEMKGGTDAVNSRSLSEDYGGDGSSGTSGGGYEPSSYGYGDSYHDPSDNSQATPPSSPLQPSQFTTGSQQTKLGTEAKGQEMLPGMGRKINARGTYARTAGGGNAWSGGNADDPGASETSWPGGGRIMTGDR